MQAILLGIIAFPFNSLHFMETAKHILVSTKDGHWHAGKTTQFGTMMNCFYSGSKHFERLKRKIMMHRAVAYIDVASVYRTSLAQEFP